MLVVGMFASWVLALYWYGQYWHKVYEVRQLKKQVARLRGDAFKGL